MYFSAMYTLCWYCNAFLCYRRRQTRVWWGKRAILKPRVNI